MGDLVRGALQSLPKHQIESGLAIGLNKAQLYRYITKKAPIKSEDELKGKKIIVAKGTTAETYMTKNKPDVQLVKYEQYSEIFQALKDGRGDGILSDNTEVIAWVKDNPSFTVGISNLGSQDTIAPAVAKGNKELKNWINDELKALGKEKFVHEAYDKTLQSVYGKEFEENLVIEGGELK